MRVWIVPTIVGALFAGCTVETVGEDDDGTTSTGGPTSSGTGGSAGSSSSSGSYGDGCEGLCAKVGDAACPNDTEASCKTECDGLYAQAPNCTAEIDALIACQIASGNVVCEPDGDAKVEGCDAEGQAFFTCLMGPTTTGACYANHGDCNPLTDSCAAGQSCDIAQDNLFHCFPPPNDAPVGSPCDVASGPYCQHGGTCVGGTCRAYCCDDTDCTIGSCQAVGSGGTIELKACQ